MFQNLPKSIQTSIAISISVFFMGLTGVMIAVAWKSLSSENVDLQIVNENLKVSAKLNEATAKVNEAKLVTDKAKEATQLSKELVESVNQDVKRRQDFTEELLTEVQLIKNSYCANRLKPITAKIEAIETEPVVSTETQKTLLKTEESLEDASQTLENASEELKVLEEETKEKVKEKENIIHKIEQKINQAIDGEGSKEQTSNKEMEKQ